MSNERNDPHTPTRTRPSFRTSVALAYALGAAIMLLLVDLAGPVDLAAFLRVLDDLADMGLVQVTDAGDGIIIVGLEIYEFAREPIRRNAALAAFVLVLGAMLVRGVRHRLIAEHVGVDDTDTVGNSYHFGLGMNLILPYGPGEFGIVRTLTQRGADADTASETVFFGRVFEVLSLSTGIVVGFLSLGWGGAFVPIVITFVFLFVLTALVRPLGPGLYGLSTGDRRGIRGFLDWMNVTDIARGTRQYFGRSPNHALGVYVISVVAIYLEVTGLWFLKEAFSTPLVVLLGDITYIQFGLVVAAASLARVVPLTPGAVGVYEGLIVALFHFAFGEGYLAAVTVAVLDGLLIALVTGLLFLYSLRDGHGVMATWRSFIDFSLDRVMTADRHRPNPVVDGDDD